MKKALIVGLIAAAMASANVQAWMYVDTYYAMEPQADIEPITFRNLEWGSDKETVYASILADGISESDCSYNEENRMFIASPYKVAGMNMLTIYMLDKNESLYAASYVVQEKHTNGQQHYLDFLELQEKLTSIYGEITMYDDQWISKVHQDDSEDKYGFDISMGYVIFCRGWKASDGSAVIIEISGDNGKTGTQIFYISPDATFPAPDVDGL